MNAGGGILTPQSTATVPPDLHNDLKQALDKQEDIDFGLDFIEKSSRFIEPFKPVWQEVQDNAMVTPITPGVHSLSYALGLQHIGGQGPTSMENRAILKDPESHQILQTLIAQGMGLLMGTPDYLKALPIGQDDPEKARYMSRLLMAFLDQPGQYGTHSMSFGNAFTYGYSVLEFGWETRTRMQMVKVPTTDSVTGMTTGYKVVPKEVVYRDQPLVREVDIFDFFPDPSGTRIQQDMACVGKRFRITQAEALRLADAGVYDKEDVVRAILRSQGRNSGWGIAGQDKRFWNLQQIPPDKYGMMTGFEIWGDMPLRRKHGSNRVITILNGERVRGHLNPNLDGMKPFKEIVVNPVAGRPYGLAPLEVIRFLQDDADNFLMLKTELANAAARGPLLVGQGFGGDLDRLKERRLLDVIPVRDVKQVAPMPVDFSVLQFAMQEMQGKSQRMREATGMTNPLQAIPSSGDRTATETSELIRLATQRVQMMIALIERDDYPYIGRLIHSRLRQYGSPEGFVARLAGDVFQVPYEMIDVDADIRFVGSDQSISLAQQNMNMSTALNMLATNPQLVEQYPDLVVRYFRDILKIADAVPIVQKAIQMSQVLQMRELMTGGGGGGTPSPSADSVERPNTEASATEQAGTRMA